MGYAMQLRLSFIGGVNVWRGEFFTALPEPEGLVEPESPTSCSRQAMFLPHAILGLVSVAKITPAYPDACVDLDYPAKEQRKFLGAF